MDNNYNGPQGPPPPDFPGPDMAGVPVNTELLIPDQQGGFGNFAVPNFANRPFDQPTAKYARPFPFQLFTINPGPTKTFDLPIIPDFWVINYCSYGFNTAGAHLVLLYGGQGVTGNINQLEAIQNLTSALANSASLPQRIVLPGTDRRLTLSMVVDGLSLNVSPSILGVVWAICGFDPKDIGVIV